MKTNVNKKSGVLLGLAAVLMLAAMMIVGCKQAQGNSNREENKKPDTPAAAEKYAVSFKEATLGSKLTAKVDGAVITSGASVEKGKMVTFTAAPVEGYKVEKWELNGKAVNGTTTYELKVSEKADVKVSFTKDGTFVTEYTATVSEGSNGKVTVAPALPTDKKAPKGQELTITATADSGYVVDTWTVTPSTALQSGGKAGNSTAAVKISADTTVHVTFKQQAVTPPAPADSYNAATGEGIVGGVKFMMKSIAAVSNGSVGHSDESDNQPHTVKLTAYRIGESEVTQELWQAVMGENLSWFKGTENPPDGSEVQEKRPVEYVDWYKCIAFCNELTKKVAALGESQCVYRVEGHIYGTADAVAKKVPEMDMSKKGFRLPTEAEWEWAAKGGTEDKWAGVNEESKLGEYAWYGANSGWKTHEVKQKQANGYGLYEMSGNVCEWCWDRYNWRTPADGKTDPTGDASGRLRVFRGGSWYDDAFCAFCAYRYCHTSVYSISTLGLRVVCRP